MQLEMTYVLFIVGLDVALAPIRKLKLTLEQQVRSRFAERVSSVLIPLIRVKDKLVVITAHNG